MTKQLISASMAVFIRPHLWREAIDAGRSHVPRRWWARSPFLPLPDQSWMRFRVETAYGGEGTDAINPDDLIVWLRWRKSLRR